MTPADKHTFWAAIAPPARLTWHQIAAVTGIPLWTVMDLIAAARAAGRVQIHDEDRQHVWIERLEAAA